MICCCLRVESNQSNSCHLDFSSGLQSQALDLLFRCPSRCDQHDSATGMQYHLEDRSAPSRRMSFISMSLRSINSNVQNIKASGSWRAVQPFEFFRVLLLINFDVLIVREECREPSTHHIEWSRLLPIEQSISNTVLARRVVYVSRIQVRLRLATRVRMEYCLRDNERKGPDLVHWPPKNDTKVELGLCIAIQGPMNEDKPNVKQMERDDMQSQSGLMQWMKWNSHQWDQSSYPAQNTVFTISDSSLIIRSIRGACVENCTLLSLWPGMVISPFADSSSFS